MKERTLGIQLSHRLSLRRDTLSIITTFERNLKLALDLFDS